MKRSRALYFIFATCVIALTSAALPSGAPDAVCDVALNGANLLRNNEDYPTEVCVENHLLSNGTTTVKVCLVTKVESLVSECTTVTVDGAVLITLPCQGHGADFVGDKHNVSTMVNVTSGNTTSEVERIDTEVLLYHIEPQMCADYGNAGNGDEFCADMKTDDISQCTSVTFKGASVIASCSCIKYNEFKIEVLRKIEDSDCPAKTAEDDDIQIHYIARNPGNQEFDNSYYNDIAVDVELGAVQFMRGWDHGLVDMCEGELRKLTIPQLFFGGRNSKDTAKILTYPGGSPHPLVEDSDTLTFHIELVKIGCCSVPEPEPPNDEL